MSERKRKRGRPRSTPVLSYSSEMKMRNSITRVIKKPRYLMEQEDESNHNHSRSSCSPSSSSRSSQFVGYDKSGTSHTHSSGGGNSKGRNKRGYNPDFDDKDSEYLYGSDFELEDDALSDDKEDLCESGSGSDVELGDDGGGGGEEEEDLAFTDGEASLSSFSTVSESQVKSCFSSRPQTPIPVWLQDREYPPLELPPSADDLLLPRAYVLKAVSIYEVLRHFRTLVRLSPMRFEDFCAALMVEEQSSLLAEVHLALLKALIREEDSQQTHFGPLDQKDSINVILYFIDTLSWPESLRLYLQSDREFLPTMRILNSCNYPYTSLVNRLQVLQFLCDQFLQTSVVREDLLSEGKLRYDDHCRACHKTGDLLCCDSCSAVYHLDCVDPPLQDIPGEMEDWTCSVCTAHQVEGVTDCISPMETSGNLCRQDPLGFDRHGRKYWFLVRRLFIESEDGEIWYYTTQAQLEEIQSMLDPADLEEDLCNTLHEIFPEMKRHMAVTESLTEENKGTRKTSLQIEDDLVKKRFDERKEKQLEREHESTDKLIEEIKQEVEVKEEPCETNDAPDTSQIKEEPEDSKDESIGHVSRLDPVTGEMIDTSKSGSKSNSSKTVEVKVEKPASGDSKENVMEDNKDKCKKEVDSISLLTEIKIKMSQMNSSTKWYRLGSDGKYKSYVNQYSSNPLALNKLQHNEERDKKRHLSHKFSLTPAAEFKWSGVLYGNKESLISTLRHTILSLEQSISSHLFHPHWSNVRKAWNLAVMSSSEPVNFSKVLMWLVACIKPVVFNSVWHDSLGHVKFNRVTALEREEKKKQEKREKKDPDQEEMRPVTIVKYTLGLKHQVWKLKGEEYRMHAMWGWQWVASHRRTKQVAMSSVGLRAGPDKYMVPIKGAAGLRSLSVNPSIFKQLTLKTPSLKPSLLSPNQLAAEADSSESSPEEKKNEIIIASASGQQKVEVGTVKLEDLFQDGLVNVSQALNSKFRFVYPKVAKASVLDSLLSRRLALRVQEEKDLANKKTQGSDTKGEEEEDEIDVENDDTDATLSDESDHENIDEIPDSQRSTIHKQRPAGNLLKEIRTLKLKYETIDELDSNYSCYSVICRDSERCQCYSPTCLLKMRTKDKLLSSVKNYRIVTSKPAPFDEVGAHSPVRLTNVDAETNSVTKVESVSESVTTTSTSTITSVNGQVVNTSVSNSVEVSQVKSENTDSSDGRSSRASSEIKIRMDEDTDETSQGSISTESKFSLKNNRIYSSESTSGKVYLKKLSSEVKRVKKLQLRIPPLSSFKIGKKTSSLDKRLSSLMVLPKWEIRMLARKGGRYYINGFNHNAKANNSVWPYPCSRPAFKTVWQYRTAIMPTLNSVAMQLRILWVCLRWDDMQEKGPGDGRKQITTDVEIVQTEILKRKHYGRFLERTEYLRRKVTIPFDVPKPVREFTPSQRSGLRKRRRAQSPVNKEPQSVEEWVEEERLDLWEIRFFGERLERAATVSKRSVGERGECIQTVTTRGSSPAEIRARMEEQLKIQRANFNQKKALESTPPGKGGIVRLSICSAGTITTTTGTKLAIPSNPNATTKVVQAGGSTIMAIGGQLPIVSGKKIMTTRDGRIITVQTTQTANSTSVSSQQSSGTTDKSISLGSSTIFPVGGAPKVQVTSQGNKVIRLQAMGSAGSQRMILPRSTNATVVQTRAPRPATPLPTPPSASTNTNTASTPSGTPTTGPRAPGQQIQIIRLPDGQLQVRGLLEGQQLVQRSDGKFQLINKSQLPSNNQSSSTGTATATATSTATSGTGTGTGTSPAIQVTQQTKTVQPSAVSSSSNTVVTPKVNSTAASSTASTHVTNTAGSHVVKVNGMQVLLKQLPEAKQVVTVGASEAAATVSTSSANSVRAGVSQSGHTSPRIKTMLAPDGTMVKTVMSTTSSSSAVSPVTTTAATNSTCTTTSVSGESPVTSSSQNNNNNTTSGSSLTLKVQVRMTEQGPKTIIQGLQPGVGLTKDHIMAIQQQVRNMLAQYNLQVNQLSPVMKLTLHVPNKQSAQPSSTATEPPSEASDEAKKSTPPQTESQQGQGNTNTAIFRNLLSPETQVASQSPAVIAVKNASAEAPNLSAGGETEASEPAPAAQSPPEDGLLSPNPANKEFVLTQEYIQQAIKSVLSRDDLNPEVEEKLMQLQKYNIEQTKKDEPPVPVSGPNTSATPNSTARNSAVKRIRDPDDSDWDPIEEKSATVVTVTPPKPRPKKPRPESRQADTAKPKKSTVKNEALDIRKKQALQHKLESLMTRHKDFLKKDILKKRAQLEKELQVEIHKELSVARVQLQMLEKNKTDSSLPSPVLSPRKKKTISESSPSQVVSPGTNQLSPETSRLTHTSSASQNNVNSNKNSSLSKSPSSKPSTKSASAKKASKNKNKKIVCICRTPFDDTKFYVGCDLCGNWFHGDCVGITEAMSRSMTEYVCDDCANAKLNKELFCFCRQPYDETQFYICCEQCEDWYHGKCVGIMQSEADDIDDYICPKCDSNNVWNYPCQKTLSSKDYVEIKKLTKGLIQHKNAWPFLEPVDPSEVPDYYKVVKEPMDLKTVENRVETKSYPRLAQFIGDVMLVFDNCRLYNPPNSSFCSCAATLESFFCQKLRSLKTRLSQR